MSLEETPLEELARSLRTGGWTSAFADGPTVRRSDVRGWVGSHPVNTGSPSGGSEISNGPMVRRISICDLQDAG